MWWITTQLTGEELQILVHENGQRAMARLCLKFLFITILFFGSLFLLRFVSIQWFQFLLLLFITAISISPVFIGLDILLFFHLPGIRLTDEGLWVKKGKSIDHKFYSYQNLVQIAQLTTTENTKHWITLSFSDGNSWSTNKRPNLGIPFLIDLTNTLKERAGCSVLPVFDSGLTHFLPPEKV